MKIINAYVKIIIFGCVKEKHIRILDFAFKYYKNISYI